MLSILIAVLFIIFTSSSQALKANEDSLAASSISGPYRLSDNTLLSRRKRGIYPGQPEHDFFKSALNALDAYYGLTGKPQSYEVGFNNAVKTAEQTHGKNYNGDIDWKFLPGVTNYNQAVTNVNALAKNAYAHGNTHIKNQVVSAIKKLPMVVSHREQEIKGHPNPDPTHVAAYNAWISEWSGWHGQFGNSILPKAPPQKSSSSLNGHPAQVLHPATNSQSGHHPQASHPANAQNMHHTPPSHPSTNTQSGHHPQVPHPSTNVQSGHHPQTSHPSTNPQSGHHPQPSHPSTNAQIGHHPQQSHPSTIAQNVHHPQQSHPSTNAQNVHHPQQSHPSTNAQNIHHPQPSHPSTNIQNGHSQASHPATTTQNGHPAAGMQQG